MKTGHLYTSIERKNKNKDKKTFLTRKDVKNREDTALKNQSQFSALKYLHESIGNQKVGELLKQGVIQPALFTTQTSNVYEIEAHRVSKEIGSGLGKSTNKQEKTNKTKKVNFTSYGTKGTANISMPKKDRKEQIKINKAIKVSQKKQKQIDPVTERGIKNLPGGRPMDKPLNDMLSRRLNYNYDKVKVHSDSPLPGKINAYAFTYGNSIVVGKNAPPKGTKKYNELIAHEATHVVQQNGSKKVPVVQRQEQKKEDEKEDEPSGWVMWLFEKALKFIGIDIKKFKSMLKGAGEVIGKIINDPGKFFGNLITAVKGGIGKFMGNILTHLKNGVMSWLFGSISGVGITLPKSFDLKGVFSIVGQVLNLGYRAILRAPLVAEFGLQGEQIVSAAEKGVGVVKDLVEKGPMAMFDHIKEMITSLPGMILDGIISFVRNTIITRAIAQIMLMLNPAGAIVGVVKGIYDVIMFFVTNWQKIVDFASAVVNSISEIAKGNVSQAIGWIEQSLARSIPLLIGFLAQFVGAGNAGKSVIGIIRKVKGKIDGLIGKVVKKIANFIRKTPIYKVLTSVGKKVVKKVTNVKDAAKKKVSDVKTKVQNKMTGNKPKKGPKTTPKKPKTNEITPQDKTKYANWAAKIVGDLEKDKGKKDKSFDEFVNKKKTKAASLDSSYQKKVKQGVKVEVKVTSQDKTKGTVNFSASIMPGGNKNGNAKYEGDGKGGGVAQWWKAKEVFTNKGKQQHKIYFQGEGKSALMKIASTPMDPIAYLQSDEVKANPENKPIQQKAGHIIGKVIGISKKFLDPKIKLTEAQEKQQQTLLTEFQNAMEELKNTLAEINGGAGLNIDLTKINNEFTTKSGEKHAIFFDGTAENPILKIASNPMKYADFINKLKPVDDEQKTLKSNALSIGQEIDKLKEEVKKKHREYKDPSKHESIKKEADAIQKKIKELVEDLEKAIKPFFDGKIPAKRYLPNNFDVRRFLYLNGSGYSTLSRKLREDGLKKINQEISNIMKLKPEDQDQEIAGLIRQELIPENTTSKNINNVKLSASDLNVDHMESLARDWVKEGHNKPDAHRQDMASNMNNFKVKYKTYNLSKGSKDEDGIKYFYCDQRWVGPSFSSKYLNSPIGAKEISGQSMLDESGNKLK